MGRAFVDPAPVRPDVSIRIEPIIHYQAFCRACGWSGNAWLNRPDAEHDAERHTPRQCSRHSIFAET